jgi:hypothetical protein
MKIMKANEFSTVIFKPFMSFMSFMSFMVKINAISGLCVHEI